MRQQINRKKIKIDPNMYIKEDASNQAFHLPWYDAKCNFGSAHP